MTMPAKPRKPLLANLTWGVVALLGLCLLYALSYAPAYRLVFGADPGNYVRTDEQPGLGIFRPVEWLVDRTPMRPVLLWWADVWRVGEGMRFDSDIRTNGLP